LKVNPGETATAGQVLVTVADLSHLWLATTDLSERDVARVAVGQPARMSVEALGKDFTGHVARIAAQASVNGGDTVYAVYINLDTQPQGLRWGMTAIVDIPGP
jgi:multidrug resistance efflux pump